MIYPELIKIVGFSPITKDGVKSIKLQLYLSGGGVKGSLYV